MNAVPVDYNNVTLQPGSPEPLGATWTGEGVNFAVYSSGAVRMGLCLFDSAGERELTRIALPERIENVFHGFLPAPHGVPGLVYALRAHGPYDPMHGLRYNAHKLLLDPHARSLVGQFTWSDALLGALADDEDEPDTVDSAPYNYKARVIDGAFDWGEDRPPATPWRDSVIYELHVKGYTKLHPRVPDRDRGTYLGLAHPDVIAHLKYVGVTAVELLPVQAFVPERFLVERGLTNFWGYSTLAWFAPEPKYAIQDAV